MKLEIPPQASVPLAATAAVPVLAVAFYKKSPMLAILGAVLIAVAVREYKKT